VGAIEDHAGAFTLYDELQAYQADEMAAGRARSLSPQEASPFTSSATYYLQALNVCDPVT
jgi:hypothetical protein